MADIGVVIPSYREEHTIGPLVSAVAAAVPGARVVVVDDSPDDRTALAAKAAGAEVVHRAMKSGRGTAVLDGMRLLAGLPWVVELDADGSHPAAQVPELVRAGQEGPFDLVIASRYLPGGATVNWPLRRRLLSHAANSVARLALGVPVTDYTTGFRAYSQRARDVILERCGSRGTGFIALSETLVAVHYAGLAVGEVPSVFTDRHRGDSSMGVREIAGGVVGLVKIGRWVRELKRARTPAPPAPGGPG